MTILRNGYEGIPIGQPIGLAASGGDAFTATDSGLIAVSGTFAHGQVGVQATAGATATGSMRWALSSVFVAKAVLYVHIDALPTQDYDLIRFTTLNDATTTGSFRINSVGKARLTLPGSVFPWTAANTFPLNTWVRCELYSDSGTSTSGTLRASYYALDSTTPIDDSGTITTYVTGSGTAYGNARFGKLNTTPTAGNTFFDDAALYTGADAALAPTPYTAPAVPPTPALTTLDGVAVIDARGSTAPSGKALSYSIAPATGVTQIVTGVFAVPKTVSATYTVTVTDTGSGLSKTIQQYVAASNPIGIALRVNGGWS